ncbi:MAG TPA: rhomboid family intramembrane serine protease [Steroidobacteraceae bacterium]|jgi:membrane associated rhomboid family serine protease
MSAAAIEIYRSPRRAPCDERALVLLAVGIPSTVRIEHGQFILEVDDAQFEQALSELRHYEVESRPVAAAAPVRRMPFPHAWVGCVGYVAVLLAVAYAISAGLFRLDAFDLGDLDAARVQEGEWWRAWTSLTLHLDAAHLAANLGAGVWFGYLAAGELGSGAAWFLIVNGAAFANWLEGELGPATHRAVGASTAVFTALGMLAAHSWRMRLHLPQRWALRWSPLVAGVVLLAWLGTAGEGTDVVAHLIGFAVGVLIGAAAALPSVARVLQRIPQWFVGLAALASLAMAWTCALLS